MHTIRFGRVAPMAAPALVPTAIPALRTRVDNDSSSGNARVIPAARRKYRRFITWAGVGGMGGSKHHGSFAATISIVKLGARFRLLPVAAGVAARALNEAGGTPAVPAKCICGAPQLNYHGSRQLGFVPT
jgi:hypothetical protein